MIATKWKGTDCLGQPLELKQLSDDIVVLSSQGGAYQPATSGSSARTPSGR